MPAAARATAVDLRFDQTVPARVGEVMGIYILTHLVGVLMMGDDVLKRPRGMAVDVRCIAQKVRQRVHPRILVSAPCDASWPKLTIRR